MTAVRDGFVLDASVALAALLDEPLVAVIPALLAAVARDPACRLVVPAAFDGECAAGLVRAVRRRRLARETAEAAWLDLQDLPLERIASLTSVFAAMAIALEHGVSAYDALYVALADELDLPLLTADARLARALAGSRHSILYVGDIDL